MDVQIVQFEEKYLNDTALLHINEMPEDLASKLGFSLVKNIFHESMLSFPGAIGLVAICQKKVVGFAFAQIDFRAFYEFQHARKRYYYEVIKGFVKKPWLLIGAIAAIQYLNKQEKFINFGPLTVDRRYRTREFLRQEQVSIGTMLAKELFYNISSEHTSLDVLTMIRPENFQSISAVSVAARKQNYVLAQKEMISFSRDRRIIFTFRKAS